MLINVSDQKTREVLTYVLSYIARKVNRDLDMSDLNSAIYEKSMTRLLLDTLNARRWHKIKFSERGLFRLVPVEQRENARQMLNTILAFGLRMTELYENPSVEQLDALADYLITREVLGYQYHRETIEKMLRAMPMEIVINPDEHYLVVDPTDDELRIIIDKLVNKEVRMFLGDTLINESFGRILRHMYKHGRHDELKQLLNHFIRESLPREYHRYTKHFERIEVRSPREIVATIRGDIMEELARINDQKFTDYPIEMLVTINYDEPESLKNPEYIYLTIEARYDNNTTYMNRITVVPLDYHNKHGLVSVIVSALQSSVSLLEGFRDELIKGEA